MEDYVCMHEVQPDIDREEFEQTSVPVNSVSEFSPYNLSFFTQHLPEKYESLLGGLSPGNSVLFSWNKISKEETSPLQALYLIAYANCYHLGNMGYFFCPVGNTEIAFLKTSFPVCK